MSKTEDADQDAHLADGDVQLLQVDDKQPRAARRGLSPNPTTNALIAGVALSAIGKLSREAVETALGIAKSGNTGSEDDGDETSDKELVKSSLVTTIAAVGATKLATRSLPGFALVSAGLFAKTLFDRSQNRRKTVRKAGAAQQSQGEISDS